MRALDRARDFIDQVGWDCDGCRVPQMFPLSSHSGGKRKPNGKVLQMFSLQPHPSNSDNKWKPEFLQRVSSLNPFAHDVTSDFTFELSAVRSECDLCLESFSSPEAKKARADLRTQLGGILNDIE